MRTMDITCKVEVGELATIPVSFDHGSRDILMSRNVLEAGDPLTIPLPMRSS